MNNVFKALNDKTRRDILELLKQDDMTAGQIAEHFNFSNPTISHHLDLLKQAGLVTSVKKGQFIFYSLNTTVMDELLKWMLQFSANAIPVKKKVNPGYEKH
jgi:DNA-binding transcriptional ArsR family regulator